MRGASAQNLRPLTGASHLAERNGKKTSTSGIPPRAWVCPQGSLLSRIREGIRGLQLAVLAAQPPAPVAVVTRLTQLIPIICRPSNLRRESASGPVWNRQVAVTAGGRAHGPPSGSGKTRHQMAVGPDSTPRRNWHNSPGGQVSYGLPLRKKPLARPAGTGPSD